MPTESAGVAEPQAGFADFALRFAAAFLVLWTPYVLISSARGHPIPPVSLWYSAMIFALPALVAAIAMGGIGRRRRALLFALLVGLFLNIQLGWFDDWIALVGIIALAGLFWLLRVHLTTILCAIFATIVVSAFLLPAGSRSPDVRETRPDVHPLGRKGEGLYIHLILDEFAGPAGVPADIEGSHAFRRELIDFFESHGFSLYHASHSDHFASADSIAELLNFEATARPDRNYHGKKPFVLDRNTYFEWLGESRGEIDVVQSNFMDFCVESPIPLASCTTYRHDGTNWLRRAELDPWAKMSVLLGLYLNSRGFLESFGKDYQRLRRRLDERGISLPELVSWNGILAPPNGLRALEQLQERALSGPRNATYFAHLLLPHFPYVFDARCDYDPRPLDWLGNNPRHLKNNTPVERAERYPKYWAQTRCTLARLDAFLAALERADRLRDATLVFQGDHGSRISRVGARAQNATRFGRADFWDGYGALLAIRDPHYRPRDLKSPVSLTTALASFARERTGPDATVHLPNRGQPGEASVFLLGEDDEDRIRIPIP